MRILLILFLISCSGIDNKPDNKFVYVLRSSEVIDPLIKSDGRIIKADIYNEPLNPYTTYNFIIHDTIKFKEELLWVSIGDSDNTLTIYINGVRKYHKTKKNHVYNLIID